LRRRSDAQKQVIKQEVIKQVIDSEKATANQQKILEALRQNPYMTQSELADALGITRKSIIANMKKLREGGFIARPEPTKTDAGRSSDLLSRACSQ
jgi:DNA-binding MarR family transcriptional regulator